MPHHLTLDAAQGERLKQEGLDAVEHDGEFLLLMRKHAIEISRSSGFVTTDNLRVIADKMGLVPRSPNSWGGIFRGPKWKIIGRQKSAVPGNHAREIKVWRYVG